MKNIWNIMLDMSGLSTVVNFIQEDLLFRRSISIMLSLFCSFLRSHHSSNTAGHTNWQKQIERERRECVQRVYKCLISLQNDTNWPPQAHAFQSFYPLLLSFSFCFPNKLFHFHNSSDRYMMQERDAHIPSSFYLITNRTSDRKNYKAIKTQNAPKRRAHTRDKHNNLWKPTFQSL